MYFIPLNTICVFSKKKSHIPHNENESKSLRLCLQQIYIYVIDMSQAVGEKW